MGKILLGVLAGVVVAGVVYYLNDPEKAKAQFNDLLDKANDAASQAKDAFNQKMDEAKNMA